LAQGIFILPGAEAERNNMNKDTVELLCDPITKQPLQYITGQDGTQALCGPGGETYPVRDGIADFLCHVELSGTNKKYQAMYDRLAPLYNYVTRTAILLMNATEETVRHEYLRELEIKPGDRVLEVSVGTGTNLRLLPQNARYYGLDISTGQLAQCKKNIKKAGMQAELFLGMGEYLPFCENSFDVVFHMGGINFFSDAGRAIREMYRVAKPGTKIVIVDETDRFTRKLAKIPVVKSFFRSDQSVDIQIHTLPDNILDVESRELFKGRLWYLGFRKPLLYS
jgi:ubiquinone/menaquinone biosynthesis C-methylase UbiE/uncharacterized protein YbaR (Trm112 family)